MKTLVFVLALLMAPMANAGLFDKIGDAFGGIGDAIGGLFDSELTDNHGSGKNDKMQNLTVPKFEDILVSKAEWVGVYHVQQLALAFNEYDLPISVSFARLPDGSLEYTYNRATRNSGEVDDGTCNEGKPLTRQLVMKKPHDPKNLNIIKSQKLEGFLYARECANGVIGDTKEIWVTFKISTTNHLVIEALILPGVSTAYHID